VIEWFLAVIAVLAAWRWLTERRVAVELTEPNDDNTVIACRVEWHDAWCYVYRLDTEEFLGQGRDIDQAVEQMSLRGLRGNWGIPKEMATKPEQIQP
jgi:hypothetical protein